MAALLRSTRFCSIGRKLVINSTSARSYRSLSSINITLINKLQQSSLQINPALERCISRHFCEAAIVKQDLEQPPTNKEFFATEICQKYGFKPRQLGEVDLDRLVTRNRLNYDGLCQHMASMDKKGNFTTQEALDLLKTCQKINNYMGYLYNDGVLLESTEHFFNKFRSTGVAMDERHYAALLDTYHITNHKFSTNDFLVMMEKDGITVSKSILSRLLRHYCQFGEMKLASDILEHMKVMEIPLSLKMYNTLITGHFVAGEPKEAMKLFYAIGDMELEADHMTYYSAILGCALNQDLDLVKQLIEMANDNFMFITTDMIHALIQKISDRGHADMFDYFLMLLESQSQNKSDNSKAVRDTITKLIQHENYEMAYRYFKVVGNKPSSYLFNVGAVASEMPIYEHVKYIRKLKEDGYNATLTEALKFAFQLCKFDVAAKILKKCSLENETIKQSYLLPLINSYKVTHNIAGLKKLIPLCNVFTLESNLFPVLKTLGSSEKLDKLIKAEPSLQFFQYLQQTKGKTVEEITEIIDKIENVNVFLPMINALENNWRSNPEELMQLISKIVKKFPNDKKIRRTKTYFNTIKKLETRFKLEGKPLRDFADRMLELDLKLPLMNLGDQQEWEFIKLLSEEEKQTLQGSMRTKTFYTPGQTTPQIDQLEQLCFHRLSQNSTASEELLSSTERNQLMSSVDFHKDFEENPDLFLKAGSALCLYERYILNNSPEKAQLFLNRLSTPRQRLHVDRKMYHVYDVATNLAKHNHMKGAMNIISLCKGSKSADYDVYKLPCHFFDNKTVEEVKHTWKCLEEKNVFETFKGKNIMVDICYKYLYNISKSCDVEEIMAAIEVVEPYVQDEHLSLPAVFTPIVQSGDKELIQKAFSLLTAKYNENHVLISLCASMVELGKLKEARNVAAITGLRVTNSNSIHFAIYQPFTTNKKLQALEDFYSIMKHVSGFPKDQSLYAIWQCMVKTVSRQECIDFSNTRFEEEDCYPSHNMKEWFRKFEGINNEHKQNADSRTSNQEEM